MQIVQSYNELHNLIQDGVIKKGFWVDSTDVNRLSSVREIIVEEFDSVHFKNLIDIGILERVNCDFSFWGEISSLKNLRYVGGTLRFGAPIKSLGQLTEVAGDMRPTTNELESLGKLKKVGGTLDLRGMVHLTDLSPLEEVGGNLNLVKSLKGTYDLDGIKVHGRIIYWNKAPEYYKCEKLKHVKNAPVWEYHSPYEFENGLVRPNKEQAEFYAILKTSFLGGDYIDVGVNRNYIRYLIYDLLNEYKEHRNFPLLEQYYSILRDKYPDLSHDCINIITELGRRLEFQGYDEVVLLHEEYDIWKQKVKTYLCDAPPQIQPYSASSAEKLHEILVESLDKYRLTSFGKENSGEVFKKTIECIREMESNEGVPFTLKFAAEGKWYQSDSGQFNPEYYRRFYDTIDEYQEALSIHISRTKDIPKANQVSPQYFPYIVQHTYKYVIAKILRDSENKLREERGLPLIGEGWISETNLYYQLKEAFPDEKVIQHARPKWLGMQHFDIYFQEHNIAIEYQGAQHYEEVEIFGGAEGLREAQRRDEEKREKCQKNNCYLIEIDAGYDIQSLNNLLRKRIRIGRNKS